VIGTDADALVKSFVEALPEREKIRTATDGVGRKDVTITFGVSLFRGYVYAKDDVLYATNTSHVSTHELEELLSKLP
jgi:hypothetical protein